MAQRTLKQRVVYEAIRYMCQLGCVVCFGLRCHHRHRVPDEGAVLVCPNHQSYLDPVLVGVGIERRLNYLARKTLFRFRPFAWLIATLDAIPLEREGLGVGGIKESLRRLKRGEIVLIFPEGRRTLDGQVQPLQPGFCALARRGKATLLPVGIAGAFEAWPRFARWPRFGRVSVWIGDPIDPGRMRECDDDALLREVEQRILDCSRRAAAALRR
jgi:1-acyl-sn-glycerol-3-phosphate acyltransferase